MNIGVNARLLVSNKLEGIPRYIYETTIRMAKQHPEDQFYLFFDRKFSEDLYFLPNVQCIVIKWPARHPVLWHIWLEYLLPMYFRKLKIDVFYAGDSYMSLRSNVPALLVCHDLAYLHYPEHIPYLSLKHYQYFFPEYHKKADHIIAVSEATKSDIIHQYKLPADKITVASNATDSMFSPISESEKQIIRQDISNGCPYILYLGALHPRKNILNLIKAFEKFKKECPTEYKLVLAGRLAWKSKEIESLIHSSSDIIHLGLIGDIEKKKVLAGADALVYVSLFEGFGLPLLEAMASGVPVITSSVSSMPEVAGDAALLVDPHDIAQIAAAMSQLVTDKSLSAQLKFKGLERIKKFDWNKTAEIVYLQLEAIHQSS